MTQNDHPGTPFRPVLGPKVSRNDYWIGDIECRRHVWGVVECVLVSSECDRRAQKGVKKGSKRGQKGSQKGSHFGPQKWPILAHPPNGPNPGYDTHHPGAPDRGPRNTLSGKRVSSLCRFCDILCRLCERLCRRSEPQKGPNPGIPGSRGGGCRNQDPATTIPGSPEEPRKGLF